MVLYIDETTKKNELVNPDVTFGTYLVGDSDYTKEEEDLYFDIIDLQLKSSALVLAIDGGLDDQLKEAQSDYDEAYERLAILFGKDNLSKTKIDYEFLLDIATKNMGA